MRYVALLSVIIAFVLGAYCFLVVYSEDDDFLPLAVASPESKNQEPTSDNKTDPEGGICPLARDYAYVLSGYNNLQPTGCVAPVCQLNQERQRIQVDIHQSKRRCDTVQSCVTVIVKTRFRFGTVVRLVNSLHRVYPGTLVIIADDLGNPKNSEEIYPKLSHPYSVEFMQVTPKLGLGLKEAVRKAKTPFVFVVEDDNLLTRECNITRLMRILEHSDAAVVGGNYASDSRDKYQGVLRVAPSGNPPQMVVQHYDNVFHETVPCFPQCYVADYLKPVFLADREAILKAGAWDETLACWVNDDFFYTMRRSGLKVVYCENVNIHHKPPGGPLDERKNKLKKEVYKYINAKWGIYGSVRCENTESFYDYTQCLGGDAQKVEYNLANESLDQQQLRQPEQPLDPELQTSSPVEQLDTALHPPQINDAQVQYQVQPPAQGPGPRPIQPNPSLNQFGVNEPQQLGGIVQPVPVIGAQLPEQVPPVAAPAFQSGDSGLQNAARDANIMQQLEPRNGPFQARGGGLPVGMGAAGQQFPRQPPQIGDPALQPVRSQEPGAGDLAARIRQQLEPGNNQPGAGFGVGLGQQGQQSLNGPAQRGGVPQFNNNNPQVNVQQSPFVQENANTGTEAAYDNDYKNAETAQEWQGYE